MKAVFLQRVAKILPALALMRGGRVTALPPVAPPRIKEREEEIILLASNQPTISIILPTFNESKNVATLLSQIDQAMLEHGYAYECIFIDDSRDETPNVILAEAEKYKGCITLVKRLGVAAKSGLTMAFRRGFVAVRGEIVVCMDTDLQHPPAEIPKLIAALKNSQADVVVASRYVEGGSAEGLNGLVRRLVSKASAYVVWVLLPATRVTTDPMTGFFAFYRRVLPRVRFSSQGFKVLVELLVGLRAPTAVDVPFTFQKRIEEMSKASLRQGIVFVKDTLRLFLCGGNGSPLVRFALCAGAGAAAYASVLAAAGWFSFSLEAFSPILLAVIVFISSVTVFAWAFQNYEIGSLGASNSLRLLGFCVFVFCIYYILPTGIAFTDSPTLTAGLRLSLAYVLAFYLGKQLWRRELELSRWLERSFFLVGALFLILIFSYFIAFSVWWQSLLFALYTLVIGQGLFALYLMIYAWEDERNTSAGNSGGTFADPHYSFTAIVPCKHETNTIADTLRAMRRLRYPEDKKQVLVVIHEGTDDGTIGVVQRTLQELGAPNMSLVTYNALPVNKPHGLNEALKQATGDFVVIFDAEDEPHPDILNVANTSLVTTKADVVQTGVQLMNYASNWYSIFNVLEYYFWFKSSLHFYAKSGVMPLGGVSVFFRRRLLLQVGGWDMSCLTEDAEIGIRLSQVGAKMSVVYDAEYATREETPPSLLSFVKQRTRWAQGFLQILCRGSFRRFPSLRQQFLAAYILAWPIIVPFIFLLLPFGLFLMLFVTLPPALAIMTNVSLLIFVAFLVVLVLGFYEFLREYQLPFAVHPFVVLVFGFYFYTLLLMAASVRAAYRNLARVTVWEKTEHRNTHRQQTTQLSETAMLTASGK